MSLDVEAFMSEWTRIALRFDSKELPGLLSKELAVPANAVALVSQDGERLMRAGEAARGAFQALLVKLDAHRLRFELHELRSADDIPVEAQLTLKVRPRSMELDLLQLRDNLLARDRELTVADLQSHFEPAVKACLRYFAESLESEALLRSDQRVAVYQRLRQDLQKTLLETGFDLEDVEQPEFRSETYERLRQRKVEDRSKVEAIEQQARLEMLRKELDKEVLLKDLEAQDEVERRRKAGRLERFEEMRKRMGEDDVKALIMMLDDDHKRAALIRELIDKDLSEDQRAGVKASEIESRLEARLKEFQEQVASLTGAVVEASASDPKTRRILAVVGKRVLSFDPSTNLHPEVPKEVFDTTDGSLGYLRSVRHLRSEGDDVYLFGAQRGIYRLRGAIQEEYLFPSQPKGKGGANAVAQLGGRLFASHSELGVVEWPETRPSGGRALFEDVTRDCSSIRGATIGDDGRLYFSAGNEIHAYDVLRDTGRVIYKGSRESITAFHLERGRLLAGNKSGQILEWSLSDPNSPKEYPVKKRNPIYMLRSARLAGTDYLVIGSKDYTTTLAAPDRNLYREYHAREEVRWVDGAGDVITGVSRSGYKIFVWDAQRQSEPMLTIRVSDKVQDLLVVKTEVA